MIREKASALDLWCPGIIIVVDHPPPNVNPPSRPLSHCGPLHHPKESAGKEQRGPLPLKRTVDQTASPNHYHPGSKDSSDWNSPTWLA